MGVACAGCSLRNEDGSCPYAKPEQEPSSVQQAYAMAQVCLDLHDALGCKWGDNPYLAIARMQEAQPEQEPVALVEKFSLLLWDYQELERAFEKVTGGKWMRKSNTPQRTWVGLTFAEICECESEYLNVFARAIEAKLRSKNNAS